MSELRSMLSQYRNITMQISISLENEDYDQMDFLIDEREKVINSLKQLSYDQSEFKSIYLELDIVSLQQNLDVVINEKKKELVSSFDKISMGRNANNSYISRSPAESVFFNKKI